MNVPKLGGVVRGLDATGSLCTQRAQPLLGKRRCERQLARREGAVNLGQSEHLQGALLTKLRARLRTTMRSTGRCNVNRLLRGAQGRKAAAIPLGRRVVECATRERISRHRRHRQLPAKWAWR